MWSDWLVFCDCGFHSVCPLVEKSKRLMEASLWERLRGKLGLVLMGRAMLSKSIIQFSVDGQGCIPSLLLNLRPNCAGGSEDDSDLLQKAPCTHCPGPCSRPPSTHAFTVDSWTLAGKSESVSCGSLLLSPGSWCTRFFLCPPRVCFPSSGTEPGSSALQADCLAAELPGKPKVE